MHQRRPPLLILFALLFLLASSPLGKAQTQAVPPGSIEVQKVLVNILDTPKYNISGDSKRVPSPQKWIEIEVEFTSKLPYIPELTFNYFVALDVKNTNTVLTGTVNHISITGGEQRYSSMYLAPQTIAAVLQGRSSFRPNIVDQATVQVSYQGTPLAEGSFQKSPPPPWWTNLRQMAGLLLNKNETPFAPLWWDRYEAIKAGGR